MGSERVVWKYRVTPQLTLPRGARVLSCQRQAGVLVLWALVEKDMPRIPREVVVLGTGHEAPLSVDAQHLLTEQEGEWVWHYFLLPDWREAPDAHA